MSGSTEIIVERGSRLALRDALTSLRAPIGLINNEALTGYGRPEDRSRILASGFQRYIQKPVEPVALARAIAELMLS